MYCKIKIVEGFFWLVVTEESGKLFGKYDLYELFPDGSESLLNDLSDVYLCIERGNDIGIELGRFLLFSNRIDLVRNEISKFKKEK